MDEDIARQWSWAYVRLLEDRHRDLLLGRVSLRRGSLALLEPEYLQYRALNVEANTVSSSKTALAHLRAYFGDSQAPADIVAHTRSPESPSLQKLFALRVAEGYEASTLHTLLRQVRTFLTWVGFEEGRNPAGDITLPEIERQEVIAFSDSEMALIRDSADWVDTNPKRGHPNVARRMVECLWSTGARQLEVFALLGSAFDRDLKTVRFTEQLLRDSEQRKSLKGDRARTSLVLPSWWSHQPEEQGLLFHRGGRPFGYRTQVNLVDRVLDVARLNAEGRRFHVFRHTYARLFIELGGRFEELQKSLGHKSITTTEQLYGHFHHDVAAQLARGRIYAEGGLRLVL